MNATPLVHSAAIPLCLLFATPAQGAGPQLAIHSGVELRWPTSAGNTYRVQWSMVPGAAWTDLDAAISSYTTNTAQYGDGAPYALRKPSYAFTGDAPPHFSARLAPPLVSLGLAAGVSGGEAYLHDGRARSLEEAILWHGGEGEPSKEAFRNLPAADRAALIKFLKSL